MLKLEKTSDLSRLSLRVRERESFFEPRLLKALTIALILHGTALILFRITPFYLSSTFTFSPIQVESDQFKQKVSTFISYIEEEDLTPPPLSLIPALDWLSFSQESSLIPSLTFNPTSLDELEDRLWPKWEEPLSLKLEEPRIQLAISGDLAQLSLMKTEPLLNELQPISPDESSAYVSYQVKLDEKTGEIFWYERTNTSGVIAIDRLTEQILLNLRFAPTESQEFVTGALDFVVLNSKK